MQQIQENRIQGGRRLRVDSSDTRPIVSIVIVVFQARTELETLLNNLASLHLTDSEIVVMDGGSSDGTVEYLRSLGDQIDFWESKRDAGIYDAMNKGILASQGEYILHLNAGDSLLQLPIDTLRTCLADHVDVASFRVSLDGKRLFQPRNGFRSMIINTWHHQGTFYRRTSHLMYDTSYRVFGDFEHNQRVRVAGQKVKLFDEVVANHESGGASSITSGTPAIKEVWRSVRQHSGILYVPIAWAWFNLYLLVRSWRNKKSAKV